MRPLASLLLALLLALSGHPRDGRPQSRASVEQGTALAALAEQLPATVRSLAAPATTPPARQHAPPGAPAATLRLALDAGGVAATTVVAQRDARRTVRALVAPYDATAPPLRLLHTNLA